MLDVERNNLAGGSADELEWCEVSRERSRCSEKSGFYGMRHRQR